MTTTRGRRLPDCARNAIPLLRPGDYVKVLAFDSWPDQWIAATPNGLIANLLNHAIMEHHEDGTITVEPSILVKNSAGTWHGFLRRGEWQEA